MSKKTLQKKKSVPGRNPGASSVSPQKTHRNERKENFWKGHWKQLSIISLFILVLYSPSLNYGYVLDDSILIVQNQYTQKGIAGIPDIFLNESFKGYFGEQGEMVEGGRYRPLSIASFAVEQSLTGGKAWFGHMVNILLYLLSGLLLYRVLLQMFPHSANQNKWFLTLPLVATILFSIHPLHVEVVANIKGRDEILAMLGELGGLYFSFKYLSSKSGKYLLFSFLCFFAGILSKEGVVTFLAIVPLTAWFFTNSSLGERIKVTVPVFLAVLVFLVLRVNAIGFLYTGAEVTDLMNNPFYGLSFGEKTATIFLTLLLYLKLLVFPHPLTHDYYPYHIPVMNWGDFLPIISLVLHLALVVIAFKQFRKKSVLSYSILFYFITLSIVSNLFISIGTFMNERFLYHSSLGFCIAAAYFLAKMARSEKLQFLSIAILSLFLAGFSYKTMQRLPDWKSQESLDRSAIKVSPNSSRANHFFGMLLWEQNYLSLPAGTDPSRKLAVLDSVKPYFDRALEILPSNSYANSMKAGVAAEYHKINRDFGALIKAFEEVNRTGTYEKFVIEYLRYANGIVTNLQDAEMLEAFYQRMISYYDVIYRNTNLPGDYRNLLEDIRNRKNFIR